MPDISEDESEQQQGHDLMSKHPQYNTPWIAIELQDKDKLQNLNIRPSGIVEVLPAPVARRVEGLKGVHADYCKIEHELKREMLELEKKASSDSCPDKPRLTRFCD